MNNKILILIISMGILQSAYSQSEMITFTKSTHTSSFDSEPINSIPKSIWEFEMPINNCSNPIIVGDLILVNAYDKETNQGYQFALDKNTGEQIWINTISEQLSTPTIKGDLALYGTKSNTTLALNIKNGKEIWRFNDLSGKTCVAPAIVDNRAYFGTHGKEWCIIDMNTGELIKKTIVENGICCFPSWNDTYIYFTDWNGNLHRHDISNLNDSIIYQTNKSSHVAPTIVDNLGLMTNDNGLLIAVDLNTGEEIWNFKPNGKLWRSPSVADNICIIVTDNSHIYGISSINGDKKWKVVKEGTIYTSASITNQIAYISCGDKKVYALNIENGKELWHIQLNDVAGQPFIENQILYFTAGKKVYAYH